MSDHGLSFEDFFGRGQFVVSETPAEASGAHLEIEAGTLQSLFRIAEILEQSASSEAAVRLATLALKRALGTVVCVTEEVASL